MPVGAGAKRTRTSEGMVFPFNSYTITVYKAQSSVSMAVTGTITQDKVETMINRTRRYSIFFLTMAMHLPMYTMDRGWGYTGINNQALGSRVSSSIGSYVSSMRKEDLKLMGGIAGGICLGVVGLALYQRIRYSGMRYVKNGYADIAEHIKTLDCELKWDIVDQKTGVYDKDRVTNLLQHISVNADPRNIKKPEDEVVLQRIQSLMHDNGLRMSDAFDMLADTNAFHGRLAHALATSPVGEKPVDTFCDVVTSFMNKNCDMKIATIDLHVERCYGSLLIDPYCFRARGMDGSSKPVPMSVLAYVAAHSTGLGVPYVGRWKPQWDGDLKKNEE
jgi:hypothetical protein